MYGDISGCEALLSGLRESEPELHLGLLIGVVCIHPELCSAIVTAIEDAGMRSRVIGNIEQSNGTDIDTDVTVVYSGVISAELLELIAHASTNSFHRILVVSWDRDPQRIADILHAGADDYLPVPFAAEELVARVNAIANRTRSQEGKSFERNVAFDFSTRTIITPRNHASLSSQEWALLMALLDAEERTVSVNELSDAMPGKPSPGAIVAVLSRLRRKLKAQELDAITIVTVRGMGYMARLERDFTSFALSRRC
jgi:DNA-binding response OmpR family regulator